MSAAKDVVSQIRKATRRKFSAEDKIKIVLEGLRGEISISELCHQLSQVNRFSTPLCKFSII